jgi:hypothetical protein
LLIFSAGDVAFTLFPQLTDTTPERSALPESVEPEAPGEAYLGDDETVWVRAEEQAPDATFGALEALLDDFRELYESSVDTTGLPREDSAGRLADLLDRFREVASAATSHAPTVWDGDAAETTPRGLEAIRSLLDAYAQLVAHQPEDNTLARLESLLDEFARLTHSNARSTDRED